MHGDAGHDPICPFQRVGRHAPKSRSGDHAASGSSRWQVLPAGSLGATKARAGLCRGTMTASVRGTAPTRSKLFQGGEVMLVLTRRVGEQIVIDGAIRVTVVAVKGKKVRIG